MMFGFKRRHNELLECFRDVLQSQVALNLSLQELIFSVRGQDLNKLSEKLDATQDNAKRLNEMMLEMKGIIAMARGALITTRQNPKSKS